MFQKIIDWFDQKFVSDWRESWKWSEIRLAAAVPIVTTLAAENWDLLLGLLEYLPENQWVRGGVVGLIIVSTFVVPVIARLWNDQGAANAEGN